MKKFRRLLVVTVVLLCLILGSCASGSDKPPSQAPSQAPSQGTETGTGPVTGTPVTPEFLYPFMTGLEKPGAIPQDDYYIAFSVGDMGNSWCRTMLDDMISVGDQYTKQYGLKFEWTSANNNTTKQLSDIQSLIAKKPDLLIVAPYESEPLTVIVDWVNEAKIPLITIIENIDVPPNQDTGYYIMNISIDCFMNGMINGLNIVKDLTERYGEPRGNVIEVAGILGATTSMQRSWGLNWILKDYPNIKIPIVREGAWEPNLSYQVGQDVMTVTDPGYIDAVAASCDDSAFGFMEAVDVAGRTEDLDGNYYSSDGMVTALRKILDGDMRQTSEATPYFGWFSFEYAIQYLNGDSIPHYCMMPQRNFIVDTPERLAALTEMVEYCEANDIEYMPISTGNFDLFPQMSDEDFAKYYEVNGFFVNPIYGEFMPPYQIKN